VKSVKNELSIRAILIGILTIWGVSFVLGSGIAVAGLLIPSNSFPSPEELKNDLPPLLFVGGIVARFFGGFVTGWIAKHEQIKNAFALATLDLIMNEIMAMFLGSGHVLSLLEGIVMTLLTTLCGGYLAKLVFGERFSNWTDPSTGSG
jgi:hypothetical protein